MSNQLKKPIDTIRDLLERSKDQLQMALPKHLTVDRMLRVAITAIQKTPQLLQCDSKSLLGAIMQAAQLGLEPDGVLGQAYLIPYRNGKKNCYEAQLQVGYKGLLALARRSGEITSFQAQVVYENDNFDFAFGINERLEHIPATNGNRGDLKAAYAIARFKDSGYAFDVMFKEDIEKIRRASKASSKDTPWNTWAEEMWRKTVAKRLCKYLPQSIELQKAAAIDEHIDMGFDVMPLQIESKTDERTENLKKKLEEENLKKKVDKKERKPVEEHDKTFSEKLAGLKGALGDEVFYRELSSVGYSNEKDVPKDKEEDVLNYLGAFVDNEKAVEV